jgi:hypothetical protein
VWWLSVLRSSTAEGGAGNGADTALDGLGRTEAKAVCALTFHPPHSKTLARGLSRGAQAQQLRLVNDLHAELPRLVLLGASFRAGEDVVGFLAGAAAYGSIQACCLLHLMINDQVNRRAEPARTGYGRWSAPGIS